MGAVSVLKTNIKIPFTAKTQSKIPLKHKIKVGVDIEKYTRGIFEYAKEAFGEFRPQMSEPGTIPDMPDYLDIVLCKKDGSIFYEMDIQRRAINIPLDFQLEGLVLEINITNCDGTNYKKIHQYHPFRNCNGKEDIKKEVRQIKINKTFFHHEKNRTFPS
mgnify:CR=1 FL=1|jgi:hypothetical protein